MNLHVTGFGPFMAVSENPSAILAAELGFPFTILEVSYRAVLDFVRSDALEPYDTVLHLGVSRRNHLCLESVACNRLSLEPDARGETWGPDVIDPNCAGQLRSTLFDGVPQNLEIEHVDWSINAGDYLCNFLLFESLRAFPTKRVGFIHVVPFETLSQSTQLEAIRNVIGLIEAAPNRDLRKLA